MIIREWHVIIRSFNSRSPKKIYFYLLKFLIINFTIISLLTCKYTLRLFFFVVISLLSRIIVLSK